MRLQEAALAGAQGTTFSFLVHQIEEEEPSIDLKLIFSSST
jgi:hypothetical protein